jgi:hypothetical protein
MMANNMLNSSGKVCAMVSPSIDKYIDILAIVMLLVHL